MGSLCLGTSQPAQTSTWYSILFSLHIKGLYLSKDYIVFTWLREGKRLALGCPAKWMQKKDQKWVFCLPGQGHLS